MIGGIHIPCDFGEEAHSDGDVLLHAIIDAIFGSIAEGDIGSHFPPTDPKWKNADSLDLLKKTSGFLKEKAYKIVNIDCTVILEKPKLLPYMQQIRQSIADSLCINLDQISVKGKTKEKVDAVGEGRAIEAIASLLISNDI